MGKKDTMNTHFDRPLSVGTYQATESFRAITQHECVCFADDGGLVALTGPAGEAESAAYAKLFAAAPNQNKALEALINFIEKHKAAFIGVECTAEDYARAVQPAMAALLKALGG